ncbi:EI24 domain-containing protein [Nereida sp. MMG025]|uniref:EI24 domain-containing protein n=1 Tax=Nereida sp. MMG025 TaxID=2909981 RepID=UPI001F3A5F8C|nr:EI24 domain-containing protein [Nereida sp. MMG025]MCF6444054.1 EI24 domain-containing protein [Nereida sp. MMG025]
MIFASFSAALAQLSDSRFMAVFAKGVGLNLALLIGVYACVFWLLGWLIPDSFTLPWIGTIEWVDTLVSWASVPLMMILSIFLMVPVASAVTGLFLDDVADAVEDKHYAHLGPAPRISLSETVRDSLSFLGLLVMANLFALILYVLFLPFAPLIFWALNGFLLGREYFQLIAIRRLGRKGAKQLRKRHGFTIWLAGGLMAIPLSIPLVNLLIPIMGAATFTHLFHKLTAQP